MNQSKVHSQGNVPFAWENQPGVSKVKHSPGDDSRTLVKLPPPPCQVDPSSPKVPGQEIHVPLPPCPFPAPVRTYSGKGGLWRAEDDDPFLAAYRECTKSVKQPGKLRKNGSKRFGGHREGWIGGGLFSCKHSCGVREDSLVKLPPISPPREKIDLMRSFKYK